VALATRGLTCDCRAVGAAADLQRDGVSWRATARLADLAPVAGQPAVVDTYTASEDLLSGLAARVPLVLLRDADGDPAFDALVVNVGSSPQQGTGSVLAGPRYACLRPRYWGLPTRRLDDRVASVLVTTGSGDLGATAIALASAAHRALPDARISLVRGPHAGRDPSPDGVEEIRAPATMLPLLVGADLALVAAGQTLLETLAVGTPSVVVAPVGNQVRQATQLAEAGAVELVNALDEDEIEERVRRLAADPARRRQMTAEGQRLLDGYGALRVAYLVDAMRGQSA
jgi:spore coat polysaccharide biosynthesis predicted glycosyltransferase SpsG